MSTQPYNKELAEEIAWAAFLSGQTRLQTGPFRALIEITRNCNFRCIMCRQPVVRETAGMNPDLDMKPALFRKIAGELFPFLSQVHINGLGETVVSPHWPEILETCSSHAGKIKFGLVTNLGAGDSAIWNKTAEAGFRISFSCDGTTKKTFEHIRRGSCFETVLENIETVKTAMARSGKGSFSFLVTLQRDNYKEMPDFVDMAERSGACRVVFASVRSEHRFLRRLKETLSQQTLKKFNFRPAVSLFKTAAKAALTRTLQFSCPGPARGPYGEPSAPGVLRGRLPSTLYPDISLNGLPREELMALKMETLRRADETGVPVVFNDLIFSGTVPDTGQHPDPLPLEHEEGIRSICAVSRYKKCFKPYSYAVINYKGDVGLCNHLISAEKWKQMGNINGTSFDEIWNSKPYRLARGRLWAGMPDNEACLWCFRHRLAE
ncbi:MAG: radical SAM protein [bacterium]